MLCAGTAGATELMLRTFSEPAPRRQWYVDNSWSRFLKAQATQCYDAPCTLHDSPNSVTTNKRIRHSLIARMIHISHAPLFPRILPPNWALLRHNLLIPSSQLLLMRIHITTIITRTLHIRHT